MLYFQLVYQYNRRVVMHYSTPALCIVMPCYNEEQGLCATIETVRAKLEKLENAGKIAAGSTMLFADDGSADGTWNLISAAHAACPERVKAVRLAGNRGKEYAMWAGVMAARQHADVVVTMDADLQFDLDAVDEFLALYAQGYDLVYGLKKNRGKEPLLKKLAAGMFYGLMKRLGAPIIPNHSDYTLMTRQVCDALAEYGESNIMFRALVKSLGFRQCPCYFEVKDRACGESKFSIRQLLILGMDAMTSFSVVPLRLIGLIGWLVFIVGVLQIAWTCVDVCLGNPPSGYATLLCSMWFLGGLGMICMAVLGEYMGKMYMETKKRPRYFISEELR